MSRLTAKDFHPEVLKLFDKYVHGLIPRRDFLKSAGKFAIGAATAEGLLQALSPRFAEAQQVQNSDPRIKTAFHSADAVIAVVLVAAVAFYIWHRVRGMKAKPKAGPQ